MNEVRQSLGEIPIVEDELRKASGDEEVTNKQTVAIDLSFSLPKNSTYCITSINIISLIPFSSRMRVFPVHLVEVWLTSWSLQTARMPPSPRSARMLKALPAKAAGRTRYKCINHYFI